MDCTPRWSQYFPGDHRPSFVTGNVSKLTPAEIATTQHKRKFHQQYQYYVSMNLASAAGCRWVTLCVQYCVIEATSTVTVKHRLTPLPGRQNMPSTDLHNWRLTGQPPQGSWPLSSFWRTHKAWEYRHSQSCIQERWPCIYLTSICLMLRQRKMVSILRTAFSN